MYSSISSSTISRERVRQLIFCFYYVSGIRIWDESYYLAHEYVRSCVIHGRSDVTKFLDCKDYIHTGYAAVFQATQMLLHEICGA